MIRLMYLGLGLTGAISLVENFHLHPTAVSVTGLVLIVIGWAMEIRHRLQRKPKA